MKKDFIVDKITTSIEDRLSGRSFETQVVPISKDEIRQVHKRDGWYFNWKKEFKIENRQLHKLVICDNEEIQGLTALSRKWSNYLLKCT